MRKHKNKGRNLKYREKSKAARAVLRETTIAEGYYWGPCQPKANKPEPFVGRNQKRYLKRQMKLKHFILTGEWKDFQLPPDEQAKGA